jgi:hypothetical protein
MRKRNSCESPTIRGDKVVDVKQEELESELPDLFTSFLGLGIPELPLPNEQDAQQSESSGKSQEADALSDDTEQLLGSLQLKKEPSPEGGEKQAKRRQQVAAACRRSRAKKKREVEELQGQVVALHKERSENLGVIETLRQQIEEMKTTPAPSRGEIDRLREENGVSHRFLGFLSSVCSQLSCAGSAKATPVTSAVCGGVQGACERCTARNHSHE